MKETKKSSLSQTCISEKWVAILCVLTRQIMTIPRIESRLEAMRFRRRLDDLVNELLPDLGVIKTTAVELQQSARFKRVLQVGLPLRDA